MEEDTTQNGQQNQIIKSFASRRGRAPTAHKKSLQSTFLPTVQLASPQDIAKIAQSQTTTELNLEIGSGNGETIAHLARQNQSSTYIASEVFMTGILQLCSKIIMHNFKNIQIYVGDGRDLLAQAPHNSLANIYLLFPDPWPKARHNKRRIITQAFLQEAYQKLKPGGVLWVSTDDASYKHAIAKQIHMHRGLTWAPVTPKDFEEEPSWWAKTKYQQKALKGGRSCAFIRLEKPPANA